MSFLKKKIDNYLVKLLGDKAIFDQEQTLEIKKKNDYYENKLNIPAVLAELNTPAPVVGDISSMTDPMPSVRLPRIPYYEYIYYLMRWNSSILRMIGFKLKQEIFRESRLHGFDWEEKFKTKCDDCGTEFEEQMDECAFCKSKKVSSPDPNQKKLLDPFIKEANKAEQTLLEVFEEEEDDLNTVDDAYFVFIKDYFVGPGGIFGKVSEVMRGDPSRFRIVSDIAGRRGGKWWICPAHRDNALKQMDYQTKNICDICGLPLQEVHYVETEAGGVTPKKYYIKGEVIHCSKYEPSRLYGIPPMFSVYIIARTIQLMDLYTEEYYEKGRLQGLLGIATDNKTELKKWIEETMTRLRNDPHYLPVIALDVGPDRGKSRMEFIKLVDNMDELKFQEHRRMLKEEIAGLFGVSLIFLADASTGGGLNNEGLQITVTDRTVEWGQSIYHDQFFPKILEYLGITDWKLKLKPSKETDEMAELQRFDQRVETATKLQQMGYELQLRDDKFEVRGTAHILEEPTQMGDFGGGFGNQQQGGNQKLLPEAQEAKPDKPKPEKEIKRSLEKGRYYNDDNYSMADTDHLTGVMNIKLDGRNIKAELVEVVYEHKRTGREVYEYWITDRSGRKIKELPYNNRNQAENYFRRELGKSLEKAQCRGRIPTTKGFHPYYCPSEKTTFEFFVDSKGQAWYIGAKDDQGKDISRWVTLGNVKTAFGWYGQEVKDGRGKLMKSDIVKVDEYTQYSVKIDKLYKIQVDKQKELYGYEQELRPLERKKKRWQSRYGRAARGEAKDKILSDLRELEHEINAMKQKIRNVRHELKRIDQNINKLIIGRSKLLKTDEFPGQDITPELQAEIEEHLEQAFSNPDNFVYVDIPESAKSKATVYLVQDKTGGGSWRTINVGTHRYSAEKHLNQSKKVWPEKEYRIKTIKIDHRDFDGIEGIWDYLEAHPNLEKQDYHFMPRIQTFDMERVNDESGQSGTGIVLSGIIFPDGKVVIRWNTETSSTTMFDSWEDFEAIHISEHPSNETKIHFYELNQGDTMDFAKAVVEPGKKVIEEYKEIEHNFAKQLEEIYLKKLAKKIAKLDDKSASRLSKEIDSIVEEATPLIEKIAFSEVLRSYKKGKKIDESREVSKTIALPENLTEPFRAEYGAFGFDKEDWQALRAIYRRNPFWQAFEGMSQSVSDKLKEHITESYEAPNSSRMKATIRDVKREYPKISKERAEVIAYGRIGKFSLPRILTMMKRTINAEVYRLERIARTETTAITSKGREMSFRERDPEGLHKYDWFGPTDKRNSEECPEIKRRIRKEGKGKGVSLERVLQIQKDVVQEFNRMRKTDFLYRDWLPHINCRHGLRRIV